SHQHLRAPGTPPSDPQVSRGVRTSRWPLPRTVRRPRTAREFAWVALSDRDVFPISPGRQASLLARSGGQARDEVAGGSIGISVPSPAIVHMNVTGRHP